MIPANRGKENNEQGMALRGTGGSGKLIHFRQIFCFIIWQANF